MYLLLIHEEDAEGEEGEFFAEEASWKVYEGCEWGGWWEVMAVVKSRVLGKGHWGLCLQNMQEQALRMRSFQDTIQADDPMFVERR